MNTKKYQWLLYSITATIVLTLVVQGYWNYKNFQENTVRINNEIQIGLDNAVENYYASLSKNNFFTLMQSAQDSSKGRSMFSKFWKIDTLATKADKAKFTINSIEIKTDNSEEYKKMPQLLDSLFLDFNHNDLKLDYSKNNTKDFKVYKGKKSFDSIHMIKGLQTVYIAYQNDTLNLKTLDSLFQDQLTQNNIKTSFYFNFIKEGRIENTTQQTTEAYTIKKVAKSTYLKPNEALLVYHEPASLETLKRSAGGIIISLMLSLSVIACLFYLLHVIKNQKAVAEIKNDLISNITHEFKTPIATIATALEAIENFNALDDRKKTKTYLDMSSTQLKKLNDMVEKLLETATLDSDALFLDKENVAITALVEKLIAKYKVIASEKTIVINDHSKGVTVHADVFHLENAIANIIDNAIKYGGNEISININSIQEGIKIEIIDNGPGIPKNQQTKIFDKFYRIPTGNQHDVKGFGIGLYYSKTIIEKHGGSISVDSALHATRFSIVLPHG